METYHSFSELKPSPVGAVTIGNFDGYHLGHESLIRALLRESGQEKSLLVTFSPHPREVLFPGTVVPKLSSSWEELESWLRERGVSEALKLHFDRQLQDMSAEEFLQNLWSKRPFKHLVVGHDFALGSNREGDASFLKNWTEAKGAQFHLLSAFKVNKEIVSSQKIREVLSKGGISLAAQFLGRNYSLSGRVVPGDGRGRSLQFPTANFELEKGQLVPGHGVYAGWTHLKDHPPLASVANLGDRPTFESNRSDKRLEVHILDFSRDLYGLDLKFEFVKRLREERKFPSIDELKSQIQMDVDAARKALKE